MGRREMNEEYELTGHRQGGGFHELVIRRDHTPESPRESKNVMGSLIGKYGGFDVFDYAAEDVADYETWEEWADASLPEKCVRVPMYAYSQGQALSVSSSPYGSSFDAGQVGYNFVPLEVVRRKYGMKRVSKQLRKKVEEILKQEIEALDLYLNASYYFGEYYVTEAHTGRVLKATSNSYPLTRRMVKQIVDEFPETASTLVLPMFAKIFK